MVLRSQENSFGAWAFLIGVILAVIIGVSTSKLLSINSIANYSAPIFRSSLNSYIVATSKFEPFLLNDKCLL